MISTIGDDGIRVWLGDGFHGDRSGEGDRPCVVSVYKSDNK